MNKQSYSLTKRAIFSAFMLFSGMASAQSYFINTIAGDGTAAYTGDGGLASAAEVNQPIGMVMDDTNNIYIADYNNHVIRKISAATGIITTIAGTGIAGFSGDGGPATAAQLNRPTGLAFDAAGNLYICSFNNDVIRKIDHSTGFISTIAGTAGSPGYSGDGGLATAAQIKDPYGIAVAANGDVYFSELSNNIIRKISASTLKISTFAGTGVVGYSGNGGLADTAKLHSPAGICWVEATSSLYIVDYLNNVVRLINSSGIISTVAGNGSSGYNGDGIAATTAKLFSPTWVAFNSNGNMFIADQNNHRIRMVDKITGLISTVAGTGVQGYSGDGGPATSAMLYRPTSIVFGSLNRMVISDRYNNRIRRLTEYVPQAGFEADVTSICAGDTVHFSDTSNNSPFWWKWSFAGGSPAIDSVQNPWVVYNTPGTYTVQLISGNSGGSDTAIATAYITVSQPSVSGGSDISACAGDTLTLSGSGASTYTWDNGVTDGNPFVQAVGTMSYIVTGTDGSGCMDKDTVSITINALPSVSGGSDQMGCSNNTITLSGSGAQTYTWNNGVTDGVPFTQALGTVSYVVTGTDMNSCENTDTVSVTVNATPTVNGGMDQVHCANDTLVLTGSGALTYTWDNAVVDGVPFFQVVSSADYIVTGTDGNGCTDTDTVTIVVNPLPNVTVSGNDTIPLGGSDVLTAYGAQTYSWSTGSTSDTTIVMPSTMTTYTVTGTDTNGCANTGMFTVLINGQLGLGVNVMNGGLSLYPNPASSQISLNLGDLKNARVSIVDASGKIVRNIQVTSSVEVLNISQLENGVYFMNIQTDSSRHMLRFVKQ